MLFNIKKFYLPEEGDMQSAKPKPRCQEFVYI